MLLISNTNMTMINGINITMLTRPIYPNSSWFGTVVSSSSFCGTFNFNTVEKKSTNSRYKNGFLIRLNKLQKTIKKNKLNITNTHLIKTFNYNNFHNLLLEIINNINTIPNTTYSNKVIQITNEYNTISTRSVIINGIENTNENTNENNHKTINETNK